ncbi:MAG: hypothetical protein Q4G03_08450 [Planctomycetia bacterium]|nr:hypothetical protein [Planctomycetia bacterium]
MFKLSSFFMSALLVVMCLWLNVTCFPNVLQLRNDADASHTEPDDSGSKATLTLPLESVEEAVKSVQPSSAVDSDDGADVTPSDTGREEYDDHFAYHESRPTFRNANMTSEDSRKVLMTPSSLETPLTEGQAFETKRELKNSSKPQGGKFVSIPSRELDVYQTYSGHTRATNRVITTTRADF